MKIELTKFITSISFALDYVESDFINLSVQGIKQAEALGIKASKNHSERVAVLVNRMANYLGMSQEEIYAVTNMSMLHDCALSEYFKDEFEDGKVKLDEVDLGSHCVRGEKIVSKLPFYSLSENIVLFHHEKADGTGPFGKTADEIPISAQLVHLADDLDVRFSLRQINEEKYEAIIARVKNEEGKDYSKISVNAFLNAIDYEVLNSITGEKSREVLLGFIPDVETEISVEAMKKMSSIFADITDYKSHFTWNHSMGIAKKAEKMGHYYDYTEEECSKLFIAGALHDVGKLFISNDILEKPGKLTDDEYTVIQNHALGTWKLLEDIGGMEDIARWAANHHEKLDGSGYPYNKKSDELTKNDRLMACLDIYQALVEERPYKAGFSHKTAVEILTGMGEKGQLDLSIIRDIDKCFGSISDKKTIS